MGELKRIGYLAPEIPAVSATFVYNEILEIINGGVKVSSYSIHQPYNMAVDEQLDKLGAICYLYRQRKLTHLLNSIRNLIFRPLGTFIALGQLISDLLEVGMISITGIKLIYQYYVAHTLAYNMRKEQIQFLHIHFGHVPTQVGMYASTISGIPFTFTTHANDIYQNALLLRRKSQRARKVITISEYNRIRLLDLGVDDSKIEILHCGVKKKKECKHYEIKHDIPVIGCLGRFVEKKGMDILIQACSILNDRNIDFRLVIAGFGPLEDELKKLAQDKGISDKIEFPGLISHDQVFPWLTNLDLFVLPCKTDSNGDVDGIPVVLMEAMACGVPVISSKISGIRELIIHNENGLLCEQNDISGLCDCIEKLLYKEDLRKSFIRSGFGTIDKDFNLTRNTIKLLTVMEKNCEDVR